MNVVLINTSLTNSSSENGRKLEKQKSNQPQIVLIIHIVKAVKVSSEKSPILEFQSKRKALKLILKWPCTSEGLAREQQGGRMDRMSPLSRPGELTYEVQTTR